MIIHILFNCKIAICFISLILIKLWIIQEWFKHLWWKPLCQESSWENVVNICKNISMIDLWSNIWDVISGEESLLSIYYSISAEHTQQLDVLYISICTLLIISSLLLLVFELLLQFLPIERDVLLCFVLDLIFTGPSSSCFQF